MGQAGPSDLCPSAPVPQPCPALPCPAQPWRREALSGPVPLRSPGGAGWCGVGSSRWVCGLISPAGVSQAWREREGGTVGGGRGTPQLLVLKTGRIHCLTLLAKKEWQMGSIQQATPPPPLQAGAQTAFSVWVPPWVWHCARKSPGPAWAGAQLHPDKGQLWCYDGHPGGWASCFYSGAFQAWCGLGPTHGFLLFSSPGQGRDKGRDGCCC